MGSHKSGEALTAGETNGANALTMIVADNGKQEDFGAMFMVTPSGDLSVGPAGAAPVHAIVGYGYQGGVGVIGRGDPQEPIRGPNVLGRGTGGHGVKGLGGSGAADKNAMEEHHSDRQGKFKPGAGLLGIGGYWIGPNSDPKGKILRDDIGGPGVVGLAGGANSEEVFDYETEFNTVKGIGVFGRSHNGAGVVGRATGGSGTAVGGSFQGGAIGVRGTASAGPGGWFEGGWDPIRAQIHLEPHAMDTPAEVLASSVTTVKPDAIDQLPKIGRLGDLLLTTRTDSKAGATFLWLCTVEDDVNGSGNPAQWRQVLLGPYIPGKK